GGSRGAEDRQFRLRGFERGARRQPAKYPKARALLPWVINGVQPERNPEAMRQGETKALRHHAHDGVGHVAETQLPSDDVWVGLESRLPDVVSDQDDPRRAGLLIGL